MLLAEGDQAPEGKLALADLDWESLPLALDAGAQRLATASSIPERPLSFGHDGLYNSVPVAVNFVQIL